MKSADLLVTDEIFSHRDSSNVLRHFNTSAMVRGVLEGKVKPSPSSIPLSKEFVDFVKQNHNLEERGLERASTRVNTPILVARFPEGTYLVIDGNHRIAVRSSMGLTEIDALIFEQPQWTPYLVEDLPIPDEYFDENMNIVMPTETI